jgi:soluble lytic murein transglycosylase-like protein
MDSWLVVGAIVLIALFFSSDLSPFGAAMEATQEVKDLVNKYLLPVPANMDTQAFFNLILSVMKVESNFNPQAVGPTGDIGLMQINPINAPHFGVTREDLFDPETNVRIGTAILREDIDRYGIRDGLAAYNGGPGNRHIPVTQAYADRVLNAYQTIFNVWELQWEHGKWTKRNRGGTLPDM